MICPGCIRPIASKASATNGNRSSSALLAAASTCDSKFTRCNILLMFDTLVARDQNRKASRFGFTKEHSILQSSP